MIVIGVVTLAAVVDLLIKLAPPQPFSRESPATLISISNRNCTRLRFFQPKQQSATASTDPGNSGLECLFDAEVPEVFAVIATVSVVDAADPDGVSVDGANTHDVPAGRPVQLNETVELNPFCGITETAVDPFWVLETASEVGEAESEKSPVGMVIA